MHFIENTSITFELNYNPIDLKTLEYGPKYSGFKKDIVDSVRIWTFIGVKYVTVFWNTANCNA